MAEHKPLCWVVSILMIVGGLNWGLMGLGMLLGNGGWNIVGMIFGSGTLAAIIYLLVGVAAVMTLVMMCKCKDCACTKGDMKMDKKM